MNNVLLNGNLNKRNANEWSLDCTYLYNGKKAQYLSHDKVKQAVAWFIANNIHMQVISIDNLYPILHPELLDIIDECQKICNRLQLNINSLLLTEELLEELQERGVKVKPQSNCNFHTYSRNNMCVPKANIKKAINISKEIAIEVVVELICACIVCLLERIIL